MTSESDSGTYSDAEEKVQKINFPKRRKKKVKYETCPLCLNKHFYSKGGELRPSHKITSCELYRQMSSDEKVRIKEKLKICTFCNSWKHGLEECFHLKKFKMKMFPISSPGVSPNV